MEDRPGTLPGEEVYEEVVGVEDISNLLREELLLPPPLPKGPETAAGWTWELALTGTKGGLDRRRTLAAHCRRRARLGLVFPGPLERPDLRFRRPGEGPDPDRAGVVLALLDCSGSMGWPARHLARSFFFWTLRLLRSAYARLETVFIVHHTEAREAAEEEFFARAGSGGTRCSSAYRLALELLDRRYSRGEWDRYVVHLSDGDNLPSDNRECLALARALLARGALVAYGEVGETRFGRPTLGQLLQKVTGEPGPVTFRLVRPADLYPALQFLFARVASAPEGGDRAWT
jgi:uncharacterized sporulation protein YeaH/YhbH (DUF444 family)